MNQESERNSKQRSTGLEPGLNHAEMMTDTEPEVSGNPGETNNSQGKKKKQTKESASPGKRKITQDKTEPGRRTKGRPTLSEGEKGRYRFLLLRDSQIASVMRIKASSVLSQEQLYERRNIIMNNTQASEYYWKLAYTYSFQLIKEKIKADAVLRKNKDEVTLRTVAEMSRIPYHNFKKMFMGKGGMANFEAYTTFLYQNGIIFQEIYLDTGVIEKAYGFYTLISDEGVDRALVEKIYY